MMAPPPSHGGIQPQGNPLIGLLFTFLPLILIFIIFYFLLIRPQQKRMKEHQKFLSELRPGQKVFTSGGVIGRVVKIENEVVWLEVNKDITIPVIKGYIGGAFNQ
jgi:preprotein translocase subunit YajC